MVPILMVWLYLALVFSIIQLPDKVAMLTTFTLTGSIPLLMMYRILTGKRKLNRVKRSEESPNSSMQIGVSDENNEHAGKD